jgi:hypothetical protein
MRTTFNLMCAAGVSGTAARYTIRLVRTVAAAASRTGMAYRCEVLCAATLEPLYVTARHTTARAAWREANEWCEQNLGQGK